MPSLRLLAAGLLLAAGTGVDAGRSPFSPLDSLFKRCRACPLDLPQCPVCPEGQVCHISLQSCEVCATVACIASASLTGSATAVLPPGVAFSTFSLAPLPPGVTRASVHNGPPVSSAPTMPGGPVESASSSTTSSGGTTATAAAQTTATPAAAQTSTGAATTSGSSATAPAGSASAATSPSVSSAWGNRHAEVGWGVEVLLGMVGWALL